MLAVSKLSDNLFKEDERGSTPDVTDQGEAIQEKGSKHKTVFHALLHCNSVKVNADNRDKITALHVACSRGSTVMVNKLLQVQGIKVTCKDKHGNTPLHAACVGGNINVVKSLIEHDPDSQLANLEEKNVHGRHPLHVAVVERHLEVVEMILTDEKLVVSKETLLKGEDNDCNSTFLLAVKSGDENMVKYLLNTGPIAVTDKNISGANALHLAAAINKENIMEMICRHDTDNAYSLLNEKDSSGCTPLHYAAKYGQVNAMSFLIEK